MFSPIEVTAVGELGADKWVLCSRDCGARRPTEGPDRGEEGDGQVMNCHTNSEY